MIISGSKLGRGANWTDFDPVVDQTWYTHLTFRVSTVTCLLPIFWDDCF